MNTMVKINNKTKKALRRNFFAEEMKKELAREGRNKSNFFTVFELANEIKVSEMTIYRYIKAKKIKAYKIGKEFRIDRAEFNNFLDKVKNK